MASMKWAAGGGPAWLAARVLACLAAGAALLSRAPAASSMRQDAGEELFEAIDPYTHGEREALERAGYAGFGPFPWDGSEDTRGVEETLGGIPILWVETAHFKLGSTLGTYRLPNDSRENEKLEAELERLRERLPKVKRRNKALDPWLRLHLSAQRLEELYADFSTRFGVADLDFPSVSERGGARSAMGEGPFLGQKRKFTVLLLAKTSSLSRYAAHYLDAEARYTYRHFPADGGVFFGLSAEALNEASFQLDAALHCTLVECTVLNLLDGFRNSKMAAPLWWKQGLGHWFSRRVDPRWNFGGGGSCGGPKADAWIWEPRVRGLVEHGVFPRWEEMLRWPYAEPLDERTHRILWSRVEFLLGLGDDGAKRFLMAVTDPLPELPAANVPEFLIERQIRALESIWGKSARALEEAWVEHVLEEYPKR